MEGLTDNGLMLALAILVFVAVSGIRIAQESERFAVSVLGRFVGLKGPGLLLKWPDTASRWVRLRLAQNGEFVGGGLVQFGEVAVPVRLQSPVDPGDVVQIISFRGNDIWVARPPRTDSQVVRCEQCGHEMQV